MPSLMLQIKVEHSITGEVIQEVLEDVSLSDLEEMDYIFLDLPGKFIDKDGKLYSPNSIIECKCRIDAFIRFIEQPNCPHGKVVITPLVKPDSKNIGPKNN